MLTPYLQAHRGIVVLVVPELPRNPRQGVEIPIDDDTAPTIRSVERILRKLGWSCSGSKIAAADVMRNVA